ncbi:MAG: hypothetical protein U5S82_14365 [Gammaproteobacteria bacterium]|nr:hypothetical protein [Gammaproteobacteria bacterium]
MKARKTIITAAGIALLIPLAGTVMAGDEYPIRHGRDLMSDEEFATHRAAMVNMTTEERQAYRVARHESMKERAAEQGVTLPDEPGMRGRGMGYGRHGGGRFATQ